MSHVTVFRFDVYDIRVDGMVRSRRWAIREAAEQIAHGVVDEATAVDVPRAFLMGEIPGFTAIGFDPTKILHPDFGGHRTRPASAPELVGETDC
jgi:hypothetical protein